MGIKFKDEVEDAKVDKDWTDILMYICAKKTNDSDFKKLFEKILSDESHLYNRKARTLKMLYDFTPLHKS